MGALHQPLFRRDFIAVLEHHATARLGDQIGGLFRARVSRNLCAPNGARGLFGENLLDTPMRPMRAPAPFHIGPDLQMRHAHVLTQKEYAKEPDWLQGAPVPAPPPGPICRDLLRHFGIQTADPISSNRTVRLRRGNGDGGVGRGLSGFASRWSKAGAFYPLIFMQM